MLAQLRVSNDPVVLVEGTDVVEDCLGRVDRVQETVSS